MEVNKAELRIPLPRKRTLRVLTLYGGGVVLLLIILDMMVRALRLPAWTMGVAVLCAIILVPVVAATTWIWASRASARPLKWIIRDEVQL